MPGVHAAAVAVAAAVVPVAVGGVVLAVVRGR